MPQLDPSSYPSQLFWLVVTFVLLYFFVSRHVLPQIGEIIDSRRAKLAHDVNQAELMREEAENARRQYEKALMEARHEANKLLMDASIAIEKQGLDRNTQLDATLTRQLDEADERIERSRVKAMETITPVAVELAGSIVKQAIGADVSAMRMKPVVADIAKGKRG